MQAKKDLEGERTEFITAYFCNDLKDFKKLYQDCDELSVRVAGMIEVLTPKLASLEYLSKLLLAQAAARNSVKAS
eukprot:13415880-Alexandrium_andersonii.AAC.1